MSEYTYSREYLREQLVEFHELMGRRSFWAGDPQKCMDALLWVYVNTPGTTESDSNLVDAAMTGYLHRKAYVDLCPAPTGDDGDTVETPTNWPERHKGFIDHVGGVMLDAEMTRIDEKLAGGDGDDGGSGDEGN